MNKPASQIDNQAEQQSDKAMMKMAIAEITSLRSRLAAQRQEQAEPIAIIGMGCRLPQAADLAQFWDLLAAGGDAITPTPEARWDTRHYFDADPEAPGKMYVRHGGFLDNIDQFDAEFFGISPREALNLDPQQRLLLEVTWEAMENAGYAAQHFASCLTGSFVGISGSDYAHRILAQGADNISAYLGTGNASSTASGRLAYVLGLKGPTLSVDTACSSSLSAVHLAVQSLRNKESQLAIAAGVNAILSPESTINCCKGRMLAVDGHCKTFDAAADGYVRGEGCGVVILKRLSDALADGDPIRAVIRGTAMNHDGHSGGLTVPNGPSQQAVIRQALDNAGLKPGQIDYIEAHGTGTALGDPIEIGALAAVFKQGRKPSDPLKVGSVKTNIGHLESASGIAGLIKVVLSLEQHLIPAHLHFRQPNPHIDWNEIPLRVTARQTHWDKRGDLRRAGVSSFGFSGTNAHIIVEQAPSRQANKSEAMPMPANELQLLPLSAANPAALTALAKRWQHAMEADPTHWRELIWTAQAQGNHLAHRLALLATSPQQVSHALRHYAAGAMAPELRVSRADKSHRPKIACLFTGQGSQYAGMGRQLYDSEAQFKATIDRCDEIFRTLQPQAPSLAGILFGDDHEAIHQTGYTQPALFALEMALYRLWRYRGLQPAALLGHSVGEFAAACAAGVFSIDDGMRLISARARLMQALPITGDDAGKMAAVFATGDRVESVLSKLPSMAGRLGIAAINGPRSIVISGAARAVEAACALLREHGINSKPLKVSHAFHSPLMAPMLAQFRAVAEKIRYRAPKLPLVSNLTGTAITILDADYWCKHVLQPVLFEAGMQTLKQAGCNIFLEIGPTAVLTVMGQACIETDPAEADPLWLASLQPHADERDTMLNSLAQLYTQAMAVNWENCNPFQPAQRRSLPSYPFQRQRYWIDRSTAPAGLAAHAPGHPLLGQRLAQLGSKEIRFQKLLSASSPAYLGDHYVYEKLVVPGAAIFSMMWEAALTLPLDRARLCLRDVTLARAIVLSEAAPRLLQVIMTRKAKEVFQFKVMSQAPETLNQATGEEDEDEDSLITHCFGEIALTEEPLMQSSVDIAAYQAGATQPATMQACYDEIRRLGVGIHPDTAFEVLHEVWTDGRATVLGRLMLAQKTRGEESDYTIHPTLLDGAFQSIGGLTIKDQRSDDLRLPTGFKQLRLQEPVGAAVWAAIEVTYTSTREIFADIRFVSDAGRVLGAIQQFRMHLVSPASLLGQAAAQPANWLYQTDWLPEEAGPAAGIAAQAEDPRYWLIFADRGNLGCDLQSRLEAAGQRCIMVQAEAGEPCPGAFAGADRYTLGGDGDLPKQYGALLEVLAQEPAACRGIVHLWSLDSALDFASGELLQAAQQHSCGSVLHLVQALHRTAAFTPAPLYLVTQGAQATGAQPGNAVRIAQTPLWGLGAVIAAEHPELHCQLIDLEPQDGRALSDLLDAIRHDGQGETKIAYRDGQRLAPRLARATANADRPGLQRPEGNFRLGLREYGVLDDLQLKELQLPAPQAQEVQIAVRSAGLNFRDVLTALGMLKDVMESLGIHDPTQLPLGGECTGVVVAVGSGVTRLAIGDEVIAVPVAGAFGSLVNAPAACVVPKPARLSFDESATIGATFLTAWYALRHLRPIKAGDRILIHAAAGGLGQAAVQLAQAAGAEIFATASPAKWDFLRAQGIRHVMDSRKLDFAGQILALTDGAGVDIVLNSLSGEFIDKSFQALAVNGHFLEAGKIGIRAREQVDLQRPDATYQIFDLFELSRSAPALITGMLQEICRMVEAGGLRPLAHQVFPAEQSVAAFRHMAQARHLGKLVLSFAKIDKTAQRIRDNASYLVTGGLGGLGLQVAAWLRDQGARHIILAGRHAPDPAQRAAIAALAEGGAEIRCLQADIGRYASTLEMIQTVQALMPPLKGVIHAAGVLDDGVIQDLRWDKFERVMTPKVAGGWNLHLATQALPIDFFIEFSSIASVLGSPGQGNYVAANAFLDGLCHYRSSQGLPALCINWGPWSGAGMAATLDDANAARLKAQGIQTLTPRDGVAALEHLFDNRHRQISVLPMDWGCFRSAVPADAVPALLRPLWEQVQSAAPAETDPFQDEWRNAAAELRPQILAAQLQATLARVLGTVGRSIDLHKNFFDMGMDSLMTVEFRNRIKRSMGYSMSPALMIDFPTPAALMVHLAAHLDATVPPPAPHRKGFQKHKPGSAPQTLVPIQIGRDHVAPVFCIPGAGANVASLHHLAAALGADVPVYGFQARGLDGETPPLTSIEAMAHHYLLAMRELQPEGPWQLLGHSFGGWIAYEMARQLEAQGEAIGTLILLDAIAPCAVKKPMNRQRDALDKMLNFIEILEMGIPHKLGLERDSLRLLEEEERLALLFERMQQARLLSGIAGIKAVRGMLNVFSANLNTSYLPASPYQGEVLLIEAEISLLIHPDIVENTGEQRQAWLAYAPALQHLQAGGNHMSMLNPPHVKQLAQLVREASAIAKPYSYHYRIAQEEVTN